MTIGKLIRTIRASQGLSQGDMAQCLGISQNYLSLVESGKKTMSVKLVETLADRLGVSKELLYLVASEVPSELIGSDREDFIKLQKNLFAIITYEMDTISCDAA
ncbi:helix-turn-helix domain-containing protein [Pseudodesulfovibrio sp. F-1]|uniref:Helix-turn-helix domain-containing protein n=1 Tax=Pseudodesulfovibrio alkaliphilus TaxID=2661613 RepID=A0A7K1KL96_9BACT|nr:helix-turn-helix transcriptional regulator [Pseudodesulfovibrio alkaliphilus]MUM76820.1 helix-turn-helix domain-containing protein [Pseudodesulfovibrio alkaliphilus]